MNPKDVVRKFWQSFNTGDLDATWTTYLAPRMLPHATEGDYTRATWLEAEKQLWVAFDGVKVEILDQVAEGDRVATRITITGTQKAEFFGVPSSGLFATLTGTTFDRVEDGQIVEHWAEMNVSGFLRQLVPSAA